jgi:hypothetical protein
MAVLRRVVEDASRPVRTQVSSLPPAECSAACCAAVVSSSAARDTAGACPDPRGQAREVADAATWPPRHRSPRPPRHGDSPRPTPGLSGGGAPCSARLLRSVGRSRGEAVPSSLSPRTGPGDDRRVRADRPSPAPRRQRPPLAGPARGRPGQAEPRRALRTRPGWRPTRRSRSRWTRGGRTEAAERGPAPPAAIIRLARSTAGRAREGVVLSNCARPRTRPPSPRSPALRQTPARARSSRPWVWPILRPPEVPTRTERVGSPTTAPSVFTRPAAALPDMPLANHQHRTWRAPPCRGLASVTQTAVILHRRRGGEDVSPWPP